jgi:prepilin-type N-terminal cleavage/methylation domain-containing protein
MQDRIRPRLTPGFTLVELLVVIAVVALLLSVMLPALQKSRETANRLKCLSGARQANMAVDSYCSDWREFYPGHTAGLPYHAVLVKEGYTAGHQFTPPGTYQGKGVFTSFGGCPHGPRNFSAAGATNAYQPPDSPYVTYGLNPTLQTGYGYARPAPFVSPNLPGHWGRYRRTDFRIVRNATVTPVLMCLITPFRPTDVAVEGFEAIRSTLAKNWMNVQYARSARHLGEGVNIVQADGSGHWVDYEREIGPFSLNYAVNGKLFGWRSRHSVVGLDH